MKRIISHIIERFANGKYSDNVSEDILVWLSKEENQEEKSAALEELWNNTKAKPSASTARSFDSVMSRLGVEQNTAAPRIIGPWYRSTAAIASAAVLVLGMIGVFTLTGYLGKVAMVEIATAAGERKQVTLPDSTKVWLNAESVLRYPEKFKGRERRVEFEGEAFFAVESDPENPFFVTSNNVEVRVTGTEFNMYSYKYDNKIALDLYKGKVDVNITHGKEEGKASNYSLLPNQTMLFDVESGAVSVKNIEKPTGAAPWMSGHLVISGKKLSEIMRIFERHYNINIDFDSSKCQHSGLFSIKYMHNESLEEALELLYNMEISFRYKIEGGNVSVIFGNNDKG